MKGIKWKNDSMPYEDISFEMRYFIYIYIYDVSINSTTENKTQI